MISYVSLVGGVIAGYVCSHLASGWKVLEGPHQSPPPHHVAFFTTRSLFPVGRLGFPDYVVAGFGESESGSFRGHWGPRLDLAQGHFQSRSAGQSKLQCIPDSRGEEISSSPLDGRKGGWPYLQTDFHQELRGIRGRGRKIRRNVHKFDFCTILQMHIWCVK